MSRRMGPLSTACTVSYCRARDEPSTRIWKEAQQRQVFGLSNGRIDSTIGERNPWLPGGIFKMEVTAFFIPQTGMPERKRATGERARASGSEPRWDYAR